MPQAETTRADELADTLHQLQARLALASSAYEKGTLRGQIRELTAQLAARPIGPATECTVVSQVQSVQATHQPTTAVLEVTDQVGYTASMTERYEAARIVRVNNGVVTGLVVTGSCAVENCHQLVLEVTAQQVRLTNCTGVTLRSYTKTGVYTEGVTGLTVEPYTPQPLPDWPHHSGVYQFNQPRQI